MADKIATYGDIWDHMYGGAGLRQDQCASLDGLHQWLNQGELCFVNGVNITAGTQTGYAANQLIPLSKISFGIDSGFRIVIGVVSGSRITYPAYVSVQFNGEGYGETFTSANTSTKLTTNRVLDSAVDSPTFNRDVDITLNAALSSSNAVNFYLDIVDDEGGPLLNDNHSEITINRGEDEYSIRIQALSDEQPSGTPLRLLFSQSTATDVTGMVVINTRTSSGHVMQLGISLTTY